MNMKYVVVLLVAGVMISRGDECVDTFPARCAQMLAAHSDYCGNTATAQWCKRSCNICPTRKDSPCATPWREYWDKWRKQTYCFRADPSPDPPRDPKTSFTPRTYAEAGAVCMGMNSKLATHHGQVADDMFPSDGESRWIGVNYDHVLETYTFNDGVPMDTSWLSWTPWDTTGGHPSNGRGDLDCTVITDGKWRSVPCTDTFQFVCEFQICPEGWMYNPHVDRCNKHFIYPENFENATKTCSQHGAIIETPRNREAERFMFDVGDGDRYGLWIGIMNIAEENTWRWNDGAEMTWNAWDGTAQFGTRASNQNCMYAVIKAGSTVFAWIRTRCDLFVMNYVCGKSTCRFPYQSVVAEGHSPFYHKCYRGMMNERVNARQAGQFCAEDGYKSNPSKLAAPITQLEEDILHKRGEDRYMFYNYGDYNYDEKWIGYTFNVYELGGKWQWNDNIVGFGLANMSRYTYLKALDTREQYFEVCTVLQANSWVAKTCDHLYGFICEREQPYVLSTCLPGEMLKGLTARLSNGYYPMVPQSQRMKCYYKNQYTAKSMNYAEADRFCSSIGGYIMMPKTNHDLLRALTHSSHTNPKHIWLGADSFGHCFNKKQWCTPNANGFKYQDGSNFTSNKLTWSAGEPNNLDKNEACIDVHKETHVIRDTDCSTKNKVICEVNHNNLRAHRNFDYITACKYKRALPTGDWRPDIDKPRVNGPWHAAPGDVCYRTPASKSRGNKRYVYSCSSLETDSYVDYKQSDSDTARPRGKDQTRRLVLSILSQPVGRDGAPKSSYIGVFYWRPRQREVKWFSKSYYGLTQECSGIGTTSASCDYGWAEDSLQNWRPGNTVPTDYNHKCTVIKPNGKWVSVGCNEKHYVSCQKKGVASLDSFRTKLAAKQKSEKAYARSLISFSNTLHIESTFVAVVVIISLVLRA